MQTLKTRTSQLPKAHSELTYNFLVFNRPPGKPYSENVFFQPPAVTSTAWLRACPVLALKPWDGGASIETGKKNLPSEISDIWI
jgi:hypothetical protein